MKQNTYACMQADTDIVISYYIRHAHRGKGWLNIREEREKEREREREKNIGKERKIACLLSAAACSLNSASAQFQGALSYSGVSVFDLTNHARV